MQYDEWLAEFEKGKKLVGTFEVSALDAVHSVRRYIEGNSIWEVAITYTGRLVTRQGELGPDGVTIAWELWKTHHEIEVSKRK